MDRPDGGSSSSFPMTGSRSGTYNVQSSDGPPTEELHALLGRRRGSSDGVGSIAVITTPGSLSGSVPSGRSLFNDSRDVLRMISAPGAAVTPPCPGEDCVSDGGARRSVTDSGPRMCVQPSGRCAATEAWDGVSAVGVGVSSDANRFVPFVDEERRRSSVQLDAFTDFVVSVPVATPFTARPEECGMVVSSHVGCSAGGDGTVGSSIRLHLLPATSYLPHPLSFSNPLFHHQHCGVQRPVRWNGGPGGGGRSVGGPLISPVSGSVSYSGCDRKSSVYGETSQSLHSVLPHPGVPHSSAVCNARSSCGQSSHAINSSPGLSIGATPVLASLANSAPFPSFYSRYRPKFIFTEAGIAGDVRCTVSRPSDSSSCVVMPITERQSAFGCHMSQCLSVSAVNRQRHVPHGVQSHPTLHSVDLHGQPPSDADPLRQTNDVRQSTAVEPTVNNLSPLARDYSMQKSVCLGSLPGVQSVPSHGWLNMRRTSSPVVSVHMGIGSVQRKLQEQETTKQEVGALCLVVVCSIR